MSGAPSRGKAPRQRFPRLELNPLPPAAAPPGAGPGAAARSRPGGAGGARLAGVTGLGFPPPPNWRGTGSAAASPAAPLPAARPGGGSEGPSEPGSRSRGGLQGADGARLGSLLRFRGAGVRFVSFWRRAPAVRKLRKRGRCRRRLRAGTRSRRAGPDPLSLPCRRLRARGCPDAAAVCERSSSPGPARPTPRGTRRRPWPRGGGPPRTSREGRRRPRGSSSTRSGIAGHLYYLGGSALASSLKHPTKR